MTSASSKRLATVKRLAEDVRTAVKMPRIDVVASRGGATEDEMLDYLRRPHPRYKVVGNKVLGAALLPLGEFDDVDAYLAERRYVRRRVRRAAKLGYTVAPFRMAERRDELLAIHKSLPERQGRPIDASYLDPENLSEAREGVECLGVFLDGVLVAYSELLYTGEVVTMRRVMGHGEHLEQGVMFRLTAGIVDHVKRTHSEIRYVFYDMFFGAADGLRYFKTQAGFRPHYVRWQRDPAAPSGIAQA